MSSGSTPEIDILIIGAGPVGLFLANECARRGMTFRIVESHAGQSAHSKALAIFPRTLEILDMAGLAPAFVSAADPVTAVQVLSNSRPLAHVRFAPATSVYPFIAMLPQDQSERLLLEALQARGGTVEYQTTLVDAVERDHQVCATLVTPGGQSKVRARFLVGCDGAHSTVRHLLRLPFEGAAYEELFMLADVETNDALPANEMQLCPSRAGPLAIFPMSSTRRRIVAFISGAEGEVPSLELVQRVLDERGPRAIRAKALNWSSFFRVHHRRVPRLQVGRIFLAGDAAHIHSPFGGQGMNVGLQDVWNLIWKLDLAVRGRATGLLLSSYTAERRPVVDEVLRTTDRLTKVMGTRNLLAQSLRDLLLPLISRLPAFQHAFVERLSELGISYGGSPTVAGAGRRYFDATLRGGHGICSQFLLLLDNQAPASLKEAAAALVHASGGVLELRMVLQPLIALIRPDGYAALETNSREGQVALQRLRELLLRQVPPLIQEAISGDRRTPPRGAASRVACPD